MNEIISEVFGGWSMGDTFVALIALLIFISSIIAIVLQVKQASIKKCSKWMRRLTGYISVECLNALQPYDYKEFATSKGAICTCYVPLVCVFLDSLCFAFTRCDILGLEDVVRDNVKNKRYSYTAMSNIVLGNLMGLTYVASQNKKHKISKKSMYEFIDSLNVSQGRRKAIRFWFDSYVPLFLRNNTDGGDSSAEWNLFVYLIWHGGNTIHLSDGKNIDLEEFNNSHNVTIDASKLPVDSMTKICIDQSIAYLISRWRYDDSTPDMSGVLHGFDHLADQIAHNMSR